MKNYKLVIIFLFCIIIKLVSGYPNIIATNVNKLPPITNAGVINPGARLGSSVAFVGIFDTETAPGVHVASEIYAFGADGLNNGQGGFYFYNLNTQQSADTSVQPFDATILAQFAITLNNGDKFGASLAALNDINGDGFPELAVGAPGDSTLGPNTGAVYVLFLGPSPSYNATLDKTYVNIPTVQNVIKITGPIAGSLYGASVAGKFNTNPKISDIIVGAPGTINQATGQVQGTVFLHTGLTLSNGALNIAATFQLTPTDVKTNTIANSGFGYAVTVIGDIDLNGVNDLAFGLPFDVPFGSVASGSTTITRMESPFSILTGTILPQQGSYLNSPSLGGPLSAGSLFGYAVGPCGDFNFDGVPDVIIGAPGVSSGDGIAYVMLLKNDGTITDYAPLSCEIFLECSNSNMGTAVFFRANQASTSYPFLVALGVDGKNVTGAALQGEVILAELTLVAPSATPSISTTPSLTPTPSASNTPSASRSPLPTVSPTPSPSSSPIGLPEPILPFLWNEKCFRISDSENCGIGIGPGYYPPWSGSPSPRLNYV